jgi:hypothetical protein
MAVRDLLRNQFTSMSLSPAARTSTATGSTIDLRGYDGAVIAVSFGAYTDGTHTPSVNESMDGSTWVACATTDLENSFTAVSSSAGANTVQQVGYIGNYRYVQVIMTISGATSGAISSAHVIAGYPHSGPTQ